MDKLDRFDFPVVTIYIQICTVYIHMVYIWYIFIYIILTVVGNAVTKDTSQTKFEKTERSDPKQIFS